MPGFDPGIPAAAGVSGIAGSSPAMTVGHDAVQDMVSQIVFIRAPA
jgi:hypothetical protein